ncbi:MAG TPA: lipid-binding SYLF domain-containing protein [Bryobacteraceae bacterium]|nr:lipid-binding SYLF domain-containing protein [Bryobacteraceae bacterium]
MRVFLVAATLCFTGAAWAETAQERLKEATTVFNEVMGTPDKGIPQELLESAHCVVIVPGLKKAAFGIGGQYGRGFSVCRNLRGGGGWADPAAVRVEGGSFGFQLGASETDVIMLVMNRKGMDRLLDSKFTLGADASVAAGPVGRTAAANTDAYMRAEILSYSRARGLFAGLALTGATLRSDEDENAELYGKKMTIRQVIESNPPNPPAAAQLLSQLGKYSFREEGVSNADRQATSPTTDKTRKERKTKTEKEQEHKEHKQY